MKEALEQRLAAKKRDLENQQEYFRIDMKNIEIEKARNPISFS